MYVDLTKYQLEMINMTTFTVHDARQYNDVAEHLDLISHKQCYMLADSFTLSVRLLGGFTCIDQQKTAKTSKMY